jgi:elongation factor Ts
VEITAKMVKELRERTGAGMMQCKDALKETGGDIEKAMDFLRKKGQAIAEKKASRTVKEGIIYSYIHHPGGKVGVMLELNCESDFVAKTDDFKALAKDIAMHIAAMAPAYVSREDVPEADVERERQILIDQAKEEGKPEQVIEKIVTGRIDKFFKENCLVEQEFVKDPDLTITDLLKNAIAKLGENMLVGRFIRFQVGEKFE